MAARKPSVRFIAPMAAQLVKALPEGDEWSYELKFDGYRVLVLKNGDHVDLRSRNDKILTRNYPDVAKAALGIRANSAIVDGEIVAVDQKGIPSFQALQQGRAPTGYRIVYYAFDLLWLDDRDLTQQPLSERRKKLDSIVGDSGLLISRDLPGRPAEIIRKVQALGLEGVLAKRASSPYRSGERHSDWQKLKLLAQQEFVVGGYRPVDRMVDALVVGYFENGTLRYAGKVRAGFVPHTRRESYRKLAPLQQTDCPFVDLPTRGRSRWGGGITAEEMKEMRWVKPELVAQIRFAEWTADHRLRNAHFLGFRADKLASEVVRE